MVENSHLLELYKQHGAAQDKYTYFLLAAAGAAIGFAVQKTEGLRLSWQLASCGVAVLCWGLSFYCGCKNISWVKASIFANYSLLQLRQGSHPEQPPHPQLVQAAICGVESALGKNTAKAAFYYSWQFRLLIAGAVFFIIWHIQRLAFAG